MDSDLQALLDAVQSAIHHTIHERKIGVAFSGGVDSSLVAKVCTDMGYDVTLLTIGFAGSHDINFAKKINDEYHFKHEVHEIQNDSFKGVFPIIAKKINTDNLSWHENCIAFYYIAKLANKLDISAVVTANGIDELFCGYNAFRSAFEGGQRQIMQMIDAKLRNELKMFEAINLAVSEFKVAIIQPLMSPDFIQYAKTIPVDQKITGSDDLMRKHIIRRLASQCGVPKLACTKRKKALQYGSKIHKTLLHSR